MTGPRAIDDGAVVGWGLLVAIVAVYGVFITAIGAAITWTWKRWRRT